MLVLAAMLISGFLFWAAFLTDDVDDDDGPDGGLMQPVYNPNQLNTSASTSTYDYKAKSR